MGMRIVISLIFIYVLLLIYSGVASANGEVLLPTPKEESIAMIETPWVVAPFMRANGFPSAECTMSSRYNNNLEITFKGKAGQLTAVRVKDLSGASDSNVKGFIGLGLDQNSYGLQSRSVNGQIDASLLSVAAPAEKLRDIDSFRLRIGTKDYYFSTSGFNDAYPEMLKCQGENDLKTLGVVNDPIYKIPSLPKKKVVQKESLDMPAEPIDVVLAEGLADLPPLTPKRGGKDVPLTTALSMIVPDNYTFNLDDNIDPMTKISWEGNENWKEALKYAVEEKGYKVSFGDNNIHIALSSVDNQSEQDFKAHVPQPLIPTVEPDVNETTWIATKGDSLIDTLKEWSQKAGVNADIDLDKDYILSQDFAILGPFDIAVAQLLEQISANSVIKPSAALKEDDGRISTITGYQGDAMIKTSQDDDFNRWRALEGTDLRKVLTRWSAKEGVDLIWDTGQIFLIKKSVKTMGEYNDAVALLVEQFNGQPTRPVVTLNIDPKTGQKALIVKSISTQG